MSGVSFGPITPTSGVPSVPQGFLGQGNLLQTNTTLLQPIPSSFRLFDSLWLLMLSTLSATPMIEPVAEDIQKLSSNTVEADMAIEQQIALLQQQIDSIHARLARAGIA